MAIRLNRHLGSVHTMDAGQFTLRTVSGAPAWRCPLCGEIQDLPVTHRYDHEGRVVPAIRCVVDGCCFYEYIVLESVREEVSA